MSLPSTWLGLVISLPTKNATARMRVWRALKSLGCGVLRDGVYLLPNLSGAGDALQDQANVVIDAGGKAHLIELEAKDDKQAKIFRGLFDRTADYATLTRNLHKLKSDLRKLDLTAIAQQMGRLRKDFNETSSIDFFPSPARQQAEGVLHETEGMANALLSPGEPHAVKGALKRLRKTDYQGRIWATRRHPWVDRLASAWLIKRFVDPKVRFLWLEKPRDCPRRAVGFDFDGAAFSHVGGRVTFETLLSSFDLDADAALSRLGTMVHYLDIGGIPVKDAEGLETILRGAQQHCKDDNALLGEAVKLFDFIYAAYSQVNPS